MKTAILFLAALFSAFYLHAEPINRETLLAVLQVARDEGVPISVAYQYQIEESGDWKTGTWGDAEAINDKEPGGWPSVGLLQTYTRPDNIEHLKKLYWTGRGETEEFNPKNPIHSAKLGFRYLSDLHRQLKTWYRAACGYNAGPANVLSGDVDRLPKYARTRAYARRIIEAKEPKI